MDKELINAIRQLIKDEINPVNDKLSKLDNKIENMDTKLDRIENRVNATFEQTAGLSEFRTTVNDKLDDIKGDIEFITKKEAENEKDIFKLKKIVL